MVRFGLVWSRYSLDVGLTLVAVNGHLFVPISGALRIFTLPPTNVIPHTPLPLTSLAGLDAFFIFLLIFQFLGALMVFKQPPSFSQLVQLELLPAEIQGTQGTRDFDVHALAKKLGVLLPYIVWDGDGQRMRIFHPSFTAMLQARHKYTINARIQHGSLIRALLRWLNKNLHFDMGGVNTSHVAPSSPPRLDPMFIYVARYLPDHFRSATIASSEKGVGLEADIIRELETFCSRHFLHWLEIVSLLKATASVPAFLSGVHYWVKVSLFRASSMFRYL